MTDRRGYFFQRLSLKEISESVQNVGVNVKMGVGQFRSNYALDNSASPCVRFNKFASTIFTIFPLRDIALLATLLILESQ